MTDQEKLVALIEEQKKIISDYQAKNEELMKGKIGKPDLDEYERKFNDRLDEISRAVAELKAPRPEMRGDDPKSETKAFFSGLRKSLLGRPLDEIEKKAMTVGDATTGG